MLNFGKKKIIFAYNDDTDSENDLTKTENPELDFDVRVTEELNKFVYLYKNKSMIDYLNFKTTNEQ